MSDVKFNLQQQPKVKGYLRCWTPKPGNKLAQLDFSAVEPTVLAEFSKCPNYRKLYHPDANPNQDVYLFVGSRFSIFKDQVLKWYDPINPTAESTALAKKQLKFLRGRILKESHLSMQYGAGTNTVHSVLTRKEIEIEKSEVEIMHQDYWSPELFAVVKDFERKLRREWNANGGWIHTGTRLPHAISGDLLKDLLSRFCQKTAHDLLVRYISMIKKERDRRRFPLRPWIADYHDETIWETPDAHTEEAIDILTLCLKQLNESLGWEIQIRGTPNIATNLAAIKCED